MSLGDSMVVVGGGGLYNVHLHTDLPGRAVEEGMGAGRPREIRITSLDELVLGTCVAGEARAVRVEEPRVASQSLVAVVEGDGLARLFGSVGATIVRAGPHSGPSVTDLAQASTAPPA